MAKRGQIIVKLWDAVKYSPITRSCGNCAHVDDSTWGDDGTTECGVIAGFKFPIVESGICKLHSSFNHGNVKHHV
jgi:hypothetical protein